MLNFPALTLLLCNGVPLNKNDKQSKKEVHDIKIDEESNEGDNTDQSSNSSINELNLSSSSRGSMTSEKDLI